jgi:hypothetical protein
LELRDVAAALGFLRLTNFLGEELRLVHGTRLSIEQREYARVFVSCLAARRQVRGEHGDEAYDRRGTSTA